MLHADTTIKTTAGIKMPRMIYGTAWKEERTTELVKKALECGFRGIDTACQPRHYQEHLVGSALEQFWQSGHKREDFFIQTKYTSPRGQDPLSIPYDPQLPLEEQVAQSFATSQKNLQTEVIDSFIMHGPETTMDNQMKVWRAMEAVFLSGKAKQIGVSNHYDLEFLKEFYQRAHIKPAIIQNRFYDVTCFDHTLRQWCQEKHIIYQSFWTLSHNQPILLSPLMQTLTHKYNRTAAQVLFRFLTQIDIVPLTGTCSLQHMKDDLAIFDFEIEQGDCKLIANLLV